MTIQGRTVGFVGAGNMGEALIKGLVVANVVPAKSIYSADVRGERLTELAKQFGIQAAADNSDLVSRCDVVILAVKPQIMEPVLREIAPAVTRQKLLISIAAGVSTAKIRAMLNRDARLIRVMPNTPALVLEGVTAIAKGQHLEPGDLDTARQIFEAVGRVVILDEDLMDAVTGLSGSGPAYVAVVIESLADGGVRMGLDRITAMTLATQTVLGAAKACTRARSRTWSARPVVRRSPASPRSRRAAFARPSSRPWNEPRCAPASSGKDPHNVRPE